jgi:hypothetical protein
MPFLEIIEKFRENSPRSIYHFVLSKITKAESHSFNRETPCVFVLSTGRTGTETLAHLLNLSRDIFAYHEPAPNLYSLSKIAYDLEDQIIKISDFERLFTTSLHSLRGSLWNESLSCGRGYAETSPQVTFLAPLFREIFPDAYFIHLVRDPKYVIRSGMRRGWFSDHPYDEFRIKPKKDSLFFKKWAEFSALEKNTWLWSETNNWISKFVSSLSPSQCFVLPSEKLFQKDVLTIQSLFDFLNVSQPSNLAIERTISKKFNKQRTGEFHFDPNWLEMMDDDLLNFLTNISVRFGYDLSESKG